MGNDQGTGGRFAIPSPFGGGLAASRAILRDAYEERGAAARLEADMAQLGYEGAAHDAKPLGLGRYRVELDGEYIGIWDANRNTFVD